eukprot:m.29734 g.29734  ORF g.29734 m.29734 type:complete len:929 (-) comp16150_c0_seq1:365-3151(-)
MPPQQQTLRRNTSASSNPPGISHGNLSPKSQKKHNRRLYDMVKANNTNRVKELIAEGADPNSKVGKKGMTAMHRVAMSGNHKLEAILADGGGSKIGVHAQEMLEDEGVFKVGDKVVLSADYVDELDALYGPLSPGETGRIISITLSEEAAILVLSDLDKEEYRYTPKALTLLEVVLRKKRSSHDIITKDRELRKSTRKPENHTRTPEVVTASGVLQQIAQMEKLSKEAQKQKQVNSVAEPMSRLAIGTKKSFRKNVKVPSAFNLKVPTQTSNPEPTPPPPQIKLDVAERVDIRSMSISTSIQEKPRTTFEFPREKLTMGGKLGEGNFGVVFAGEARGLVRGEAITQVAVKTLNDSNDDAGMKTDFLTEADIMKSLTGSDKVVRLLGIITKGHPFCMLMEIMSNGDLKKVLRENRPKKTTSSRFSWSNMAEMAGNIAEGMSYLASKKIVHRDLAARNCLVNASYVCKIGDFGLTRSVYSQEYYRMTGSSPLPIRWMAPESLDDGVSTGMSDVWSFGVVVWEIATFAKLPYGLLSNMEVCEKVVEEEFRMPQPKGCPDELYDIMCDCWKEDQDARPQFSALFERLKKNQKTLSASAITMVKKGPAEDPKVKSKGVYIDPETVVAMDSDQDQDHEDDVDNTGPDHYSAVSPATSAIDEVECQPNTQYERQAIPNYYSQETQNVEDQPFYSDVGNSHLSDFEMAVANANDASNVKTVELEKNAVKKPWKASTIEENMVVPRGIPEIADDQTIGKDATTRFPTPSSGGTQRRKDQAKLITSELNAKVQRKTLPVETMRREKPPPSASKAPARAPSIGGRKRMQSTSPAEKEAECAIWIEGLMGMKIPPGTLADVLKGGDVLCTLLNTLKPGSIKAKFKKEKHAVRQRQNIAWFLEALPSFGIQDRDRFETNDLFEKNDMKQVLICMLALKRSF